MEPEMTKECGDVPQAQCTRKTRLGSKRPAKLRSPAVATISCDPPELFQSPATPAVVAAMSPTSADHRVKRMATKWLIGITAGLSTALSLVGGLLMYFESISSLKETVKQLSEAEVGDVRRKLQESFHEPRRNVQAMQRVLWQHTEGETPLAVVDRARWLSFGSIVGSDILQEVGVVLLPNSSSDPNLIYQHNWFDPIKSSSKHFQRKEALFTNSHYSAVRAEGAPNFTVTVNRISYETGLETEDPYLYNFSAKEYIEQTNRWPDWPAQVRSNWNTTTSDTEDPTFPRDRFRWRTPQYWIGSADNAVPYTFVAYETLHESPPFPHPWHNWTGVFIQSYINVQSWDLILEQYQQKETTIVVFDRTLKHVYATASTKFSSKEIFEKKMAHPACNSRQSMDPHHTPAKVSACLPQVSDLDHTANEAVSLIGDSPAQFQESSLDQTKYFIRHVNLFRAVSEGNVSIDAVIVWYRPVSSVESDVNKALLFLIGFSAIVLLFDIILGFCEFFFIARPLSRLSKATAALANLDIETAKKEMESQNGECLERLRRTCCTLRLAEVDMLFVSFHRTLEFLAEYVKYLPETLANCDTVTEGDPGQSDPTTDYTSFTVEDERRIQRLKELGLTHRWATVMKVEIPSAIDHVERRETKTFASTVLSTARCTDYRGVLLQITPTSIIITWNTHNNDADHANSACKCACTLRDRLREKGIKFHIAVATGNLLAGVVGDEKSKHISAHGHALTVVHHAAHLAQKLNIDILISGNTHDKVQSMFDSWPLDVLRCDPLYKYDGTSSRPVLIYEIRDRKDSTNKLEYYTNFNHFHNTEFDKVAEPSGDAYPQAARLWHLAKYFMRNRGLFPEQQYYRPAVCPLLDYEASVEEWDPETTENRVPQTTEDEKDPETTEDRGVPHPETTEEHEAPQTEDEDKDPDTASKAEYISNPLASPHSLKLSLNQDDQDDQYAQDAMEYSQCEPTTQAATSEGRCKDEDTPHSSSWSPHAQEFKTGASPSISSPTFDPNHDIQDGVYTIATEVSHQEYYAPVEKRPVTRVISDDSSRQYFCSEKMLGKGSYGQVWKGLTNEGEIVALKVVSMPQKRRIIDEAEYQKAVEELKKEIEVLRDLQDDNIVKYYGSMVSYPHLFIVMEFMPGGSLASMIQDFTKLPLMAVCKYTKDMLSGLHYLHRNKVIHRDLKPANVLVGSDGVCKLADFGSSIQLQKVAMAEMKEVAGTLQYMPPEAIHGESVDESCDIWAIGISVYEMLTGKLPYPRLLPEQFAYSVGRKNLRPHWEDVVTDSVCDFLSNCCKENAKDRSTALKLQSHPMLILLPLEPKPERSSA